MARLKWVILFLFMVLLVSSLSIVVSAQDSCSEVKSEFYKSSEGVLGTVPASEGLTKQECNSLVRFNVFTEVPTLLCEGNEHKYIDVEEYNSLSRTNQGVCLDLNREFQKELSRAENGALCPDECGIAKVYAPIAEVFSQRDCYKNLTEFSRTFEVICRSETYFVNCCTQYCEYGVDRSKGEVTGFESYQNGVCKCNSRFSGTKEINEIDEKTFNDYCVTEGSGILGIKTDDSNNQLATGPLPEFSLFGIILVLIVSILTIGILRKKS